MELPLLLKVSARLIGAGMFNCSFKILRLHKYIDCWGVQLFKYISQYQNLTHDPGHSFSILIREDDSRAMLEWFWMGSLLALVL